MTISLVAGQVPTAAQWNGYFNGKVDVGPTLALSGAQTGLVNATIGGLTGIRTISLSSVTGPYAPFNILQTYESVAVPSGVGYGFWSQLNTGGGLATGGRVGLYGTVTITATTGNNGGQYTAVGGEAYAYASDLNGLVYGGNFTAQTGGGATLQGVVGAEFNCGIMGGTVAAFQTGVQVVQFGNGVVAGTSGIDSAYVIGDQGGRGFDYGFRISGVGSQIPVKTTGTLFGVTTAGTVAQGFALNGITISGDAFRSPGIRILGGAAGLANFLTLAGGAGGTGNTAPTIYTQGSTADIDLNVKLAGTGDLQVFSGGGSAQIFQVVGETTSNGWLALIAGIAASRPNQIFINGTANNLLFGGGTIGDGGMNTTDTSGFPMLPYTSGIPTGTPVNSGKGAAIQVNANSSNLNIYVPGVGWRHVVLLAGAA